MVVFEGREGRRVHVGKVSAGQGDCGIDQIPRSSVRLHLRLDFVARGVSERHGRRVRREIHRVDVGPRDRNIVNLFVGIRRERQVVEDRIRCARDFRFFVAAVQDAAVPNRLVRCRGLRILYKRVDMIGAFKLVDHIR